LNFCAVPLFALKKPWGL